MKQRFSGHALFDQPWLAWIFLALLFDVTRSCRRHRKKPLSQPQSDAGKILRLRMPDRAPPVLRTTSAADRSDLKLPD